jgi:hypothetical protein
VKLSDLVPPDVPPLSEVLFHQGTHSRLAFAFEKRFCRPPASHGSVQLFWREG